MIRATVELLDLNKKEHGVLIVLVVLRVDDSLAVGSVDFLKIE